MRHMLKATASLLLFSAVASQAMADGPPSMIHGFANAQASNDYITPRGLLVTNEGITEQYVAGLVLLLPKNFSVVVGSWNDADFGHQHTQGTGAWVEEDFFAGVNYKVSKQLKLTAQYDSWNFPSGSPSNEQNLEFIAAFDDSKDGRAWSLQPHAEVFWAIASKSSVVVLGRPADTGTTAYLELGATPTLKLSSIPVTLTMPTWVSVGPSEFWCDSSNGAAQYAESLKGVGCGSNNFGVFSTGLTATTPLSFIPSQYGHWSAYIGAQYFNLLNGALVDSQALTIGSLDGHRNVVNGMVGFSLGF